MTTDPATRPTGARPNLAALAERLAFVDAEIDRLQGERATLYRAARRLRVGKAGLRALAARQGAASPSAGAPDAALRGDGP